MPLDNVPIGKSQEKLSPQSPIKSRSPFIHNTHKNQAFSLLQNRFFNHKPTNMSMASSTALLSINFGLCPSNQPVKSSHSIVNFLPYTKKISLNLTSSRSISGSGPLLRHRVFTVASPSQNPQSLTIVSAKGYKRKTHKASAKRFRVTGSGKIVRRRAGKQHLLAKKNTKRKLRLSKMLFTSHISYNSSVLKAILES